MAWSPAWCEPSVVCAGGREEGFADGLAVGPCRCDAFSNRGEGQERKLFAVLFPDLEQRKGRVVEESRLQNLALAVPVNSAKEACEL